MSYRNKTYICFDGDTDIRYYRLMTAWKAHDGNTFNFHDAHDLNSARDTSSEESIKRQLRERFANSKMLIVLIGESTKNLYKFVRWEMETAINLKMPIIGINLNGSRQQDARCPPIIRDELVAYTTYNPRIIEHAMANWPDEFLRLKRDGVTGPRSYNDSVYKGFGL